MKWGKTPNRRTPIRRPSVSWFGYVILTLCIYFAWHYIQATDQRSQVINQLPSDGRTQSARVVAIADGDSLVVLMDQPDGRRETRVRLEGIDCPELGQPFHRRAKQFLSDLCLDQDVQVQTVDKDQYGRLVARMFVGDRDLRLEMLQAGLAWHFVRYNNQAEFAAAEALARSQKIGLWRDDRPIEPWVWRREHPRR